MENLVLRPEDTRDFLFEPSKQALLKDLPELFFKQELYQMMLEAIYKLAQEGQVAAGSNVWSWSGEGRPAEPGTHWEVGQPFTGDPPHEQQGWYSIYADDESTLELLARYAKLMDELDMPLQTAGEVQTGE